MSRNLLTVTLFYSQSRRKKKSQSILRENETRFLRFSMDRVIVMAESRGV